MASVRTRQPDAPRLGKALGDGPDPARHPQRLLDRQGGLRYARSQGSDILSVRQIRRLGVDAVLERIPAGTRYYLTIDIDGFDRRSHREPARRATAGSSTTRLELIAGLAKRGSIVGIDLVEVAPDYDHTGTTAILAAQLLMNLIGRVLHQRTLKG